MTSDIATEKYRSSVTCTALVRMALALIHCNLLAILVMCSISTNGERASLANLKLTIGSLLEYS